MKPRAHFVDAIVVVLMLSTGIAQAQTASEDGKREKAGEQPTNLRALLGMARSQKSGFSLMPSGSAAALASGPSLPVLGSGTIGRLTKWTGLTSSNSFIGDTTIFEDKFGNVGVGTDTPTSKLTVAGTIQSTNGGFKFPDGSVQTTSAAGALASVVHDMTLTGSGTAASPLGVASPLEVRDVDNPARQPVQFGLVLGNNTFTVPAGKRLVIENVSGFFVVPTVNVQTNVSQIVLRVTLAGIELSHFLTGYKLSESGGSTAFALGQTTRLYADPGSVVTVLPIPSGSWSIDLAGHYVDLP